MKKKDIEAELEFLETSAEARAAGLRRIKRRHYTGPQELLPKEDQVKFKVSLDPEVADFFQNEPEKINGILRSAMEKTKIRDELLADSEFVDRLREKLAA